MLVLALCATGCTARVEGHAQPVATGAEETVPRSIPSGVDFPDASEFTAANYDDYFSSYPYFGGINFATPDRFRCNYNSMNRVADSRNVVLTCDGPLPAAGPGNWAVEVGALELASAQTAPPSVDLPAAPKLLPPKHTIEFAGGLCAVDTGLTACNIGPHGFVATPTSMTLF